MTASTAYVGDIKQAIRFAAGDLKGQQFMPGFCLPKVTLKLLFVLLQIMIQQSCWTRLHSNLQKFTGNYPYAAYVP